MSQRVVTNVDYSYGSMSGYVNSISISTGSVPDSSDYEKLNKRIVELQEEIEVLKNKMSILEMLMKEGIHRVERNHNDSIAKIYNILDLNVRQISDMINL